jgi:hypothetical protein
MLSDAGNNVHIYKFGINSDLIKLRFHYTVHHKLPKKSRAICIYSIASVRQKVEAHDQADN